MNVKKLSILIFCFHYSLMNAAVVLTGDSAAPAGNTFSFLANHLVQEYGQEIMYVGAAATEAGKTKEFAIGRIVRGQNTIDSLTPAKVSIAALQDQDNPLYDQGIAHLDLLEGLDLVSSSNVHLVAVPANNITTAYLFFQVLGSQHIKLLISGALPDAAGAVTGGIAAIGSGLSRTIALVAPNGGSFGAANSGVGQIILGVVDNNFTYAPIDATTGNPSTVPALPLPIDTSSAVLKIGSNLNSIAPTDTHVHFESQLGTFFIGLTTTAGPGALDGARSVALVHVNENQSIRLDPIAPDAAFSGLNNVLGVVGASESSAIYNLKTMITSTSLSYLITLGGVVSGGNARRKVSAFPLVTRADDVSLIGTIASKNAIPEDLYSETIQKRFIARFLKTPARVPADMPVETDTAVQVGGGILPDGDITDIFVNGDMVFAVVQNPSPGFQPGIFYSRALFMADGRIKGWSFWRRVQTFFDATTGAIDSVQTAKFDRGTGGSTAVIPVAGTTTIIKQMRWGFGDEQGIEPLSEHAQVAFPAASTGIQNQVDIPLNSSGLSNIAIQVTMGINNLMLAQTGLLTGGVYVPISGAQFDPVINFTNGAITQNFPVGATKVITVEGGVLKEVGPLYTAVTAADGNNNGYLLVGGTNGVAILSRANGDGWDTTTGELGNDFAGLTNDMAFKKLGNYRFVRKLFVDDVFLYVLTDTTLDRIDMSLPGFGLGTIVPVTIASTSTTVGLDQYTTFQDVVVSSKLAILATSKGLMRAGNNANVQTATQSSDIRWVFVPLGEGVASAYHLYPATTSGINSDLARGIGGHLYVLDAYRGKNIARVHRFAINAADGINGIDNNTVQPLPDIFAEGTQSYLLNFGAFRNLITADGDVFFNTTSKQQGTPIVVYLIKTGALMPLTRSGVGFLGVRTMEVSIPELQGSLITAIARNSASGAYLLTGDFGMRAIE